MEQVIVTVEAQRCHQCRQLMSPTEEFFQHQVMAAVSENRRTGITHTYKLADVCHSCHERFVWMEKEAQARTWWRRFWWGAVAVSIVMNVYLPVGFVPLIVALLIRFIYKLKQKRTAVPALRSSVAVA